jgi:hypothetical protein
LVYITNSYFKSPDGGAPKFDPRNQQFDPRNQQFGGNGITGRIMIPDKYHLKGDNNGGGAASGKYVVKESVEEKEVMVGTTAGLMEHKPFQSNHVDIGV